MSKPATKGLKESNADVHKVTHNTVATSNTVVYYHLTTIR